LRFLKTKSPQRSPRGKDREVAPGGSVKQRGTGEERTYNTVSFNPAEYHRDGTQKPVSSEVTGQTSRTCRLAKKGRYEGGT